MDKRSFVKLVPTLTAVAFGAILGALGYCGLTFLSCFVDGDPSRYPVTFPFSILGGMGCALELVVLALCYRKLRRKYPSVPMTVADAVLALASVLPALMAWSKLAQLLLG